MTKQIEGRVDPFRVLLAALVLGVLLLWKYGITPVIELFQLML